MKHELKSLFHKVIMTTSVCVIIALTLGWNISCSNSNKSNNYSDSLGISENAPKNYEILKDFKVLYDELISFKNKPDFVDKGFSQGSPYASWLKKVESFTKRKEAKDLYAFGIGADDLQTLGLEYKSSKGEETETTINLNKHIKYAFEHSKDEQPTMEEKKSASNKEGRDVIGKWNVKNKMFPNDEPEIIEIYSKEGKYYVATYFPDKSGSLNSLKKEGNKYFVTDSPHQEYYVIKQNGDLRMCDAEGDFTEASGYIITKLQ